jgi:hypothetical protein
MPVIGRLLTTGAAKRAGPAVPEEVVAVMEHENGAATTREAEATGPRS